MLPNQRAIILGAKANPAVKLLHVSGIGIVTDAANGSLTNGSASVKAVTDYQGTLKTTLANEIRFQGTQRVENILPIASNIKFGSNSETTPAPTNGIALTNCPDGFTSGFQYAAGCTGGSQKNITIPANYDVYKWSFIVYNTEPGGGAVLALSNVGINAVSIVGGDYNFDTGVSTLQTPFVIKNLGNNYYEISMEFTNNGSGTIFVTKLLGSTVGMSKLVFTGHQILRLPTKTMLATGLYRVPKGVYPLSYFNSGKDGVKYETAIPCPFTRIAVWGDSICGAAGSDSWHNRLNRFYGQAMVDSSPGQISTYIKDRFLSLATSNLTDIVIFEMGRNNSTNPNTVLADIATCVALLPHNKFIVCSILNSISEYEGTNNYNACRTLSASIQAAYPNNYVDIMQALLDGANLSDPIELAAWNIKTTTARLQGDGLHPTAEGQATIVQALKAFIDSKGWITSGLVPVSQVGILHEPAQTNLSTNFRDFTNAAWVKTTLTAAKTAIGIDRVANAASTITATADNATALQTLTSVSSIRITSCYVKQRTGTGLVQLTQDNGSTWTAVPVTSSWSKVNVPSVTSANPVFGLRLVTNGDAIDVDYFQHELMAFATSPIAATTTIDAIKLPLVVDSNFPQSAGVCVYKITPQAANSAGTKSLLCTNSVATDFIYDNGSGEIALGDGTNTAITIGLGGWNVGDSLLIIALWNATESVMCVCVSKNGGDWVNSHNAPYDKAFPVAANLTWCNGNTDSYLINSTQVYALTTSLEKAKRWAKTKAVAQVAA